MDIMSGPRGCIQQVHSEGARAEVRRAYVCARQCVRALVDACERARSRTWHVVMGLSKATK